VRVALDWTLGILFSKDFIQFETVRARTTSIAPEARPAPPEEPVLS